MQLRTGSKHSEWRVLNCEDFCSYWDQVRGFPDFREKFMPIFSSLGRSPGRAVVLPLASASASALAKCLNVLCDGQGAARRAILSL